ncbi:MAG: hypothetical protein ACRD10_01435 [Terriglobia bacterium]
MDHARLKSAGRILAVLAIAACLPRCAMAQQGADQVSTSIFDPVNNAIRVEAFPGGSGTHTPSGANQVFTSVFDATNNAIHVDLTTNPPSSGNCLIWNGTAWEPGACGSPGSSTFQVNGKNATVQTLINFQSSAVTNGLTFTFTNFSAGNIQLGISGTLNDAGLTSTYSGVGTCAAGQFVSGLTRNAAPTCGTPAGGGSGTVTSFSAGTLAPLFTTSVATLSTTPALSFAISKAAADSWFGNTTGSSAAPSFNTTTLPVALIPALNYQATLSTFPAPAHEFLTGFTSPNTFTAAQPGFSDLSGTAALAQLPALSFANLTGTIAASQLPDPTATTLGGVESAAAVQHEWLNSISTLGVPSLSQPAFSDLSGTATLAQLPSIAFSSLTGTAGDAQLANAYSGVGACPASQFVSGLTRNAAPTCGTPAGGGLGTVTSVDLALPSIFTVSGSPVTASGTLTATLSAQSANAILAGPASGGAAAPAFRALVAGDIPALSYQAPISTFVAPAHEFVTGFTAPNTLTAAQPGFADLSDNPAAAQLAASPVTNDCLGYNGTILTWFACGSGLPASWTLAPATNEVTVAPAANQDATTLNVVPSLSAGGTFNIFQVAAAGTAQSTSCSAGVYFAVQFNGNLCFQSNNLELGYDGQPNPSYLKLHGGIGNADYVRYDSPALSVPATPAVSDPTDAGSTIAASTYTFWFTYMDGPGNIHETTKSAPSAVTISTANHNDIDITPPTQISGATAWHLYGLQSINGTELDMGVKTDFSTTIVLTSWSSALPAGSPPTSNTTGGVYQTYLTAGNEEAGDACVSATVPGLNCAAGTWIMTNPLTAAGDIFYGGAVNGDGFAPPTRLAIGSVGQCLGVATATMLGWQTCGSGGSSAFQVNGTALTSSATINFQNGGPITFSNPSAGNITVSCCGATTFTGNVTLNGNLNLGGNIQAPFPVGNITIQGGQDSGNSGTLGLLTIRGAVNAGTGAGGSVVVAGGQDTSTGVQGIVVVKQPVKVGTVAHSGDLVAYSAADTVSDCALACANAVGIVEAASGFSYVDLGGVAATAYFDTATTTIGDVACSPASGGVAGELHDNGVSACPSGTEKIGVVKTAGTANVAQVVLFH